jgi:hypothetical protein
MPSRLSSLLVRDGLVGIKRMERAFQRQVIYGGTLDTILLEMNLVTEDRLLQYLSLSTGVPPATRAETRAVDKEAVKRLPKTIAARYQAAPLAYDGEHLRVVVKESIDVQLLEELANELGIPIQPLVVPEYRFHLVYNRAYAGQDEARFKALAERDAGPDSPDVSSGAGGSGADSVVLGRKREAEPPPAAAPAAASAPPATAPQSGRMTMQMHAVVIPEPMRAVVPDGPASTASTDGPAGPGGADGPAAAGRLEVAEPSPARTPAAVSSPQAEAAPPAGNGAGPIPGAAAPVVQPQRQPDGGQTDHDSQSDHDGLSPHEAMRLLETAQDRDEIFDILLRAVRSRAWCAGLLTVQGGAAIGRVARCGDASAVGDIGAVRIPLDVDSTFKQAITMAAPYIGPIASGNPLVDSMIRQLGGVMPPSALLLPIALRNRTVALVVGHRGADALSVGEISELLPMASATASALSRLIIRAKKVGYRPAVSDDSAPRIQAAQVEDKPTVVPTAGSPAAPQPSAWTAPSTDEAAPAIDFNKVPSVGEATKRPVEVLLNIIESQTDVAGTATAELLRRATEAMPAISARFPGKLVLDRYAVSGRPVAADRHGPLLALIVKLGTAAADLLIAKMRDRDRDVRYYATLCAAELRPRTALRELVERLFDVDFAVRTTAIDALRGYPARELEGALDAARRALKSDDIARAQAAATALADLADIKAVPTLIDLLAKGGDLAASSRTALEHLTRQDHGTSIRKWRAWWDKNRDRFRVEWMLDALSHKQPAIRKAAAEDLRRVTGEFFGYRPDASKREREQALQKWEQWWERTGKARFGSAPGGAER